MALKRKKVKQATNKVLTVVMITLIFVTMLAATLGTRVNTDNNQSVVYKTQEQIQEETVDE